MRYIAMTGEFFAVIMEGTQYERDVGRRFPGQPLPDETTKVSLYQLELCTRAIMDRRLEPARTVLNLCASDQENIPALLRGVDQLKEMFPNCAQQDARTHGLFLHEIHSNYIQERGYMTWLRFELQWIYQMSNRRVKTTLMLMIQLQNEGEESDGDTHLTSSERFTVENNADRRARYLCSTMSECSSPGFWQRLHHFDQSFSEAEDEKEEG